MGLRFFRRVNPIVRKLLRPANGLAQSWRKKPIGRGATKPMSSGGGRRASDAAYAVQIVQIVQVVLMLAEGRFRDTGGFLALKSLPAQTSLCVARSFGLFDFSTNFRV